MAADHIEHGGHRRVIQYRGDLLPLVWLSELMEVEADVTERSGSIHVAVCSDARRSVGLVVDEILDVTETTAAINPVGCGANVLGTVVIQGHAADVLDVPAAFEQVGWEFESETEAILEGAVTGG